MFLDCRGPRPPDSSRQQVNAPPNNQADLGEIEVTDPTHPLYGRRFSVRSITRQPHSPGFVFVAYREVVTLRIPLPATNLASDSRRVPGTKLTSVAIQEFLSLVQECEASCHQQRPLAATPSVPETTSH